MKPLKGKWALVTGSSRSIGQQIAMGLAQEGANVIVHGRSKEHNRSTTDLLKKYEIEVDSVEGELSSMEGVEKVIKAVIEKHGGVDILYNNAAIQGVPQKIFEIPINVWKELFQVNLFSMILLCNAFAPKMRERGFGRIINLGSGIKGQPDLAAYSVTKGAVEKYTFDLSTELQGSGVLVNTLDPGWLRTDMGGPNGEQDVATVLPGAIVPALFKNDGPTGTYIRAQDYRK
jgi:NAD(P)-dependent dehydrogenase (short-subunit alcohol dehydrogenase family)